MQNLNKEDIKKILQERAQVSSFSSLKDLPHPFVLKDAKKAAEILKDAMAKNKRILVVGDYDADGTLGVVIFMSFFSMMGYENISYCIPNRFKDGYGLKPHLIEQNPSDVVITIDNGIAAFSAAEYCLMHQITLIVTDHHAPQKELPRAHAIINPMQDSCKFPQKEICGASVAWYFCNAIKIQLGLNLSLQPLLKYVAIATIADVMPLTHLNKIFVKKGLEILQSSMLPSDLLLKSLLKTQKIYAQDVAFYLAPLLNSAGRMADARLVCEFFLSSKDTNQKFLELCALNTQRKELVQKILMQAQHSIQESRFGIVAYEEGWSEGVVGIVAAKLAEAYQKPAFVFALKDGVLKGSGRSDGMIDIFETLLPHQEHFLHFGGHSAAVGISIELGKLPLLLEIFNQECKKILQEENHKILGILNLELIDAELIEMVRAFEPFGKGNPVPCFISKSVRIKEAKTLKQVHQKLLLHPNISGVHFFVKEFFAKDDVVDLCFSLQYDHSPSLLIEEIKKCPL